MMSIGTPITASGAKEYFKKDLEHQMDDEVAQKLLKDKTDGSGESASDGFADANGDKLIDSKQIVLGGTLTCWQGELAEEFGLEGRVEQKDFKRLADGRHPQTRAPLIKHVAARTKTKANGKEFQTKTHRAGLDQTISAPKSVTLVAVQDARVIKAHLDASFKAVKTAEEATCAKMGNVKLPEQTGRALYATFLHFEARPAGKSGHVAPELHTHFFEFNVARTANGKYRALEMRKNYRAQKLATAVYRSELRREMTALGYEMRVDDKTGAPEVASISRDYIEANSPRQNEIIEKAQELKIKSTKTVAANYRQKKKSDKSEMVRKYEELEKFYDYQAANAACAAKERVAEERTAQLSEDKPKIFLNKINATNEAKARKTAEAIDRAVAEARLNNKLEKKERKFVTRQSILADALNFAPTEITISEISKEFTEREKRGEFDEFDFDRRQKSFAGKKVEAAEQNSYEKSITNRSAAASAVRHNRTEVSKFIVESNSIANLNNASIASRSGAGKTFVEKIGEKCAAKSHSDEPAVSLHLATRRESAANLEKTAYPGRRNSNAQRDGTIDQADRSREKINSDESATGGKETVSKFIDRRVEVNAVGATNRNSRLQLANSHSSIQKIRSGARNIQSGTGVEKGTVGVSNIRQLVEKYQGGNCERIRDQESSGFGTGDSEKRSARRKLSEFNKSQLETENSGRFDSATTRKSETRGDFHGENDRAQMGVGDKLSEMGDAARGDYLDGNDDYLFHNAESNGGTGEAESGKRKSNESLSGSCRKQKSNDAKLFGDGEYSQNDFPARQRLLQTRAEHAAKNHSKSDEQTCRQIAAKTAQIINVKFFAGQLDERITNEWTRAISKQPADRISAELLFASEAEEDQKLMAEKLHTQTKNFAEDLKLPVPAMPADRQQCDQLLAEKLTEIEAKNYEAATGEKIGAKTFEILAREKLSLAEISVSIERQQEIAKSFEDLPITPTFNSALEAETFAALLAPVSFGCNEEQIDLTRKNVERNELVSREAATLVQIAYGGQANNFNDNFNRMLADEIYYQYQSPIQVYDYAAGSNWQGMVKTFAPLVDHLAAQNQLQIIPPANNAERSKMLADFATRQIAETFKAQNEGLQKWAEVRLNADFQKSAGVQINSSQQTDINKFAAENNLTAPKFSSSLDADAYRLSKYDDDKKAEYAEEKVSAVEAKVKAEAVEKLELEQESAWVMSM